MPRRGRRLDRRQRQDPPVVLQRRAEPAVAGAGRRSGRVRLVARHSGKCLDVTGHSTADGARLIQYACGGGQNQQFTRNAT
ncbi:RICIN domain-containing protein [Nonomuraea candida]|uniref:RICIN domain-containing protein n=1 Tax=Nonomuraea candida TaxID=359159 RepID=UPI0034E06169